MPVLKTGAQIESTQSQVVLAAHLQPGRSLAQWVYSCHAAARCTQPLRLCEFGMCDAAAR